MIDLIEHRLKLSRSIHGDESDIHVGSRNKSGWTAFRDQVAIVECAVTYCVRNILHV